MNTYRSNAILAGVLYIVGTVDRQGLQLGCPRGWVCQDRYQAIMKGNNRLTRQLHPSVRCIHS